MAGYVKCKYCGKKEPLSEKDNMYLHIKTVESSGKQYKSYYHHECWKYAKKQLEEQEKENREKDELDKVVKEIYMVEENVPLPSDFWQRISDIRNGTIRGQKGRSVVKRRKQGVPYRVIKEAYLMAKPDIEWARLGKNFRTLLDELKYGLRIVENKLADAYRKVKNEEHMEKVRKELEEQELRRIIEDDTREVKYVKKKYEYDISHILGDD
jgi:hypothetical protein